MTHKDAPERTAAQVAMESFYAKRFALRGTTIGFSRNKDGNYHSQFAQDLWEGWQESSRWDVTAELARQHYERQMENARNAVTLVFNQIDALKIAIEEGDENEALTLVNSIAEMRP